MQEMAETIQGSRITGQQGSGQQHKTAGRLDLNTNWTNKGMMTSWRGAEEHRWGATGRQGRSWWSEHWEKGLGWGGRCSAEVWKESKLEQKTQINPENTYSKEMARHVFHSIPILLGSGLSTLFTLFNFNYINVQLCLTLQPHSTYSFEYSISAAVTKSNKPSASLNHHISIEVAVFSVCEAQITFIYATAIFKNTSPLTHKKKKNKLAASLVF